MLSFGKRKLVVEACRGRARGGGRRRRVEFRTATATRRAGRCGACCRGSVAGLSADAGAELVEAMLASAAGAARAREWRILVE